MSGAGGGAAAAKPGLFTSRGPDGKPVPLTFFMPRGPHKAAITLLVEV